MQCRVCFSTTQMKLLSLFSVKIGNQSLAEVLTSLAGIEVSLLFICYHSLIFKFQIFKAVGPQMICVECLGDVTNACETKRKVLEADKRIRNLEVEEVTRTLETQINTICVETIEKENVQNDIVEHNTSQTRKSFIQKISRSEINSFPEENLEANQSECASNSLENKLKLSKVKNFHCDICSFSSHRKKNVERHILAVHMKAFKFICEFNNCKREYTTQAALKFHRVRDHDDQISKFQCDKCKTKFSCESLLNIHLQRLNCRPRVQRNFETKTAEKSLICPHCDFKTAHKFSLQQHVNLLHLNIRKSFNCSHCEISYSNKISLKHHLFRVHKLSHIRCAECEAPFSNEEQLKAHKDNLKCNARKATEEDYEQTEQGVKCTICNRSYRSKKEWITHYFNHHKFNKICDICNLQLSTYASLKNHKKTIHDKIKRFACSECNKTFAAKHTWLFHVNTHSGILFDF